jgi:two-component system KDP operon response regulator KdpE
MEHDKTLLAIEDEPAILRFLKSSLEQAGWDMIEAQTGKRGLELAATCRPEAILLDLGLPDQDGLQTLKSLRQWTSAPVIIVSARGQESDKIAGLDAGADDYLTKPFGVAELLARLRVAMRHAQRKPNDAPPVYENEGLKVDLVARRVTLKKKDVHLSPLQYDVLATLVRHAGQVVSQAQLIKEVWGESRDVAPESLRILIHQIRHRLEADPVRPTLIKTEPGVGYRLETND